MKRNIYSFCTPLLAACLLPFLASAEGGKNLTPNDNGVTNLGQSAPLNNVVGFLQNGDNSSTNSFNGYFLYSRNTTGVLAGDPAFSTDYRLKIRMRPGETLYYGIRRCDGLGATTIRIMADIAGVETILQTTNLTFTTDNTTRYGIGGNYHMFLDQPGVIGSHAQQNAGPSAIVGAAGYNALVLPLPAVITTPTDVWVEILDDGGNTSGTAGADVYTERDVYDLWDFSVYDGTTERTGRLHSKYWSFNCLTASNRLSDNFRLFPAIPNDTKTAFLIKGLVLRGMQPFGFSFVCNSTGTLTNSTGAVSTDFRERRKSKLKSSFVPPPGNAIRTDVYPEYDIFVNDPDSLFWPTGSDAVPVLPFNINTWCADPLTGRGALSATINFAYPANVQIYGELNGTPGYQPGTTDVLFEVNRSSGVGQIFWDGRDGLGNIVPNGTNINVQYRVQRFPVHYPIYDPENNDLGFRIENIRPNNAGPTGIAYWDDSNIIPNSSSLIGTPSGTGVHPWGGTGTGIMAPDVGNVNLMNTWTYGAEREMPLILPFRWRCNSDNDPMSNPDDIDDDNDGITDVDESGGVDPLQDHNSDGLLNHVDVTYPGFIDVNFDGVNDNFDKDGDRIINELDVDSDNDGIPDVVEAFGVDENSDGRIDNYTDTDGDGLSENVDRSNSLLPGPSIGLGLADFDGDGLPNYLDRDSDNDGIPDLVEAGGADANNNGLVDALIDLNNNGLVDALQGDTFADADFDGLTNAFDGDVNGDMIAENPVAGLLRSGADINNDGRADSYPFQNLDGGGRPNPYDLDSDGDGINDVREAGFADTNNDGQSDGTRGTDGWDDAIDALTGLGLLNTDTRSEADYLDIDADDDGIPDNVEGLSTGGYQLPLFADADGDGIDDRYDASVGFGGNGITPFDMDGDLVPDYRDLDTDNDGRPDIEEGNDFNNNGWADDVPTGLAFTDGDGDGLIDFFDVHATARSTSGRMGNLGTTTGDATPGSSTTVQRNGASPCPFERDWRCLGITLPLAIKSFSGNMVDGVVNLQWVAETSAPLQKLEVERSVNGGAFQPVLTQNTLQPQGTHIKGSFSDKPGADKSRVNYRLKLTGAKGEVVLSRHVSFAPKASATTLIINNPVTDWLQISIKTAGGKATIQIHDMNGRMLQQQQMNFTVGVQSVALDCSHLAAGTYILTVREGKGTVRQQFVVQ